MNGVDSVETLVITKLADANTTAVETTIKNADVEAIRAADVSIMPDNVAQKMTPQQLADLIAYMKWLK